MKNLQLTKQQIGIAIAVVIVLCGASFYAGNKYGQGQNNNNTQSQQASARFGQGGGARGMRGGAGFINGNVLSKDDKSITVQLHDGGSKIVFLSGSATIAKAVQGSVADLTVGQQVMVNGTANPDGSITAQNVQIRPNTPGQQQPGR